MNHYTQKECYIDKIRGFRNYDGVKEEEKNPFINVTRNLRMTYANVGLCSEEDKFIMENIKRIATKSDYVELYYFEDGYPLIQINDQMVSATVYYNPDDEDAWSVSVLNRYRLSNLEPKANGILEEGSKAEKDAIIQEIIRQSVHTSLKNDIYITFHDWAADYIDKYAKTPLEAAKILRLFMVSRSDFNYYGKKVTYTEQTRGYYQYLMESQIRYLDSYREKCVQFTQKHNTNVNGLFFTLSDRLRYLFIAYDQLRIWYYIKPELSTELMLYNFYYLVLLIDSIFDVIARISYRLCGNEKSGRERNISLSFLSNERNVSQKAFLDQLLKKMPSLHTCLSVTKTQAYIALISKLRNLIHAEWPEEGEHISRYSDRFVVMNLPYELGLDVLELMNKILPIQSWNATCKYKSSVGEEYDFYKIETYTFANKLVKEFIRIINEIIIQSGVEESSDSLSLAEEEMLRYYKLTW